MFDYYKGVNVTNSSMTVQCVYEDVCSSRHTKLCKDCKYNKECGKEIIDHIKSDFNTENF